MSHEASEVESNEGKHRVILLRSFSVGSLSKLVLIGVAAVMLPLWFGLGVYVALTDGQLALLFFTAKGLWLLPAGFGLGVLFTMLAWLVALPAAYVAFLIIGAMRPLKIAYRAGAFEERE